MDNTNPQSRITLKNLKVADFASEETLCFKATVYFDGVGIAQASNDGHGGMTFIHALDGKAEQLAQAQQYAKGLPPEEIEGGVTGQDIEPFTINMTLDFLIDQLAASMHADRKLRSAFARDIANKVFFIRAGKLLFLKGVKLKEIPDKDKYFAALRARQCQPITILAELPSDEAFSLWKRHVLGDDDLT